VSIKGFVLIAVWALLGIGINTQFDPTTVIGSVMGSVFIFIWVAILVIGVFSWIKLKKFKDK
jgi:hypothetical protein